MTCLYHSPDLTTWSSTDSSCDCNGTTESDFSNLPCNHANESTSLSPFSVYDLPELPERREMCSKPAFGKKFSATSRRRIREFHSFSIVAIICLSIQRSEAFVSPSHSFFKPPIALHARTASSTKEETIEAVAPMTSSSKERRLSAQRAWEKARDLDLAGNIDGVDTDDATPFLDLFTDAGIATVKNIPSKKSKRKHTRPRGRPDSVPGAMSRTTLLNNNDRESRLNKFSERPMSKINQERKKSVTGSSIKKRGRGRPRKYPTSSTSIDEITKIAATSVLSDSDESGSEGTNGLKPESPGKAKRPDRRRITGEHQIRQQRNHKNDSESTGMMQSGKRSRKGKGDEPPNLQRYYRTELLSSEEEYTIGMKIRFMMKCEQVHEGLFRQLDRPPSIAEWGAACGFKDVDKVMCDPNYVETGLERQIRPSNSEAWDAERDPNMFVGNGLVNASGPGRGRGRVKKSPPTSLAAFYDDSEIKILQSRENLSEKEVTKLKKELDPVNTGSPRDFVEIMLIAKEAKQRMVQCNMRLVVSIAKRYRHVGVNIADLVQEGSIGLTRAAEKFDPKKGFKFSTYASW